MKYNYENIENVNGEILKEEISNVKTYIHSIKTNKEFQSIGKKNISRIYILIKGNVTINENTKLCDKGICAFIPENNVLIKADTDAVILEINVQADLSNVNNTLFPYYLNYSDADIYKEECKSEKTINRFLLKHRILPHIAIGSVETTGPDKVGVHKHPLVEQLFYSFDDNKCNLEIDEDVVSFGRNTLFHIPLASKHGIDIPKEGKAHYVWIDYILNEKGLEYMDEAHK